MQTVRIALVGGGFALRTQLPAFRRVPGTEVRCLVGHDPMRTEALARQHGIPVWSIDLAAALQDPSLDLVCVSTPPDLHRHQAELALRAGKHVLCEKPMALDAGQAESMCETAAASKRLALVDHELRFSPGIVKLRRLVREGYVGAPLHVQATVFSDGWLDRNRPFGWWNQSNRGGGVLGALGSHVFDLLLWIFGDVRDVTCFSHTFVEERARAGDLRLQSADAEDYVLLGLRLGKRPVHAQVLASVVAHRGGGLRVEVHGDEGVLVHDAEGFLRGSRRDPARSREPSPLESLVEPADAERLWADTLWDRAFAVLGGEIVRSVREGSPVVPEAADFAAGLAVQRVLDAARLSAASGRVEPVMANP